MRSLTSGPVRALGATVVALAALTLSVLPADASDRRPTQLDSEAPRLELVGQDFALEPNGVIRLDYRLVGIVDDALELAGGPAAVDEPADTTTATVPEAPEPVPEPLPLTIEVTNYQPVTDSADVDDVVGSDVDPDAFEGAIDGVAITDLHDRATVAADGSIEFTLEIQTDVTNSIEERLKFERAGLYPLRVQLLVGDPRADDIVATAGTIVQRLPETEGEAAPPIDLAVVTATPSPSPRATPAERATARQALTDAVDLAAALDAPTTLEVPPALVAEEAATGPGAERLARSLAGDELVALPLVPLDVSSAVAAGQRRDLHPARECGRGGTDRRRSDDACHSNGVGDVRGAECRGRPATARSGHALRDHAVGVVPPHGEFPASRHQPVRRR